MSRVLCCAVMGWTISAAAAELAPQVEFTVPTPLLNAKGELEAWGWAKRAIMTYNRDAIPADRQRRVKEWEHYTILTPNFAVGVTMADIGYAAFGSAEFVDYSTKTSSSRMFLQSSQFVGSRFPSQPHGSTTMRAAGKTVSFEVTEKGRVIAFDFPATDKEPAFRGRLTLDEPPGWESVAIARPFAGVGEFFYENKIFGMPATGEVTIGESVKILPVGQSFAIFDWGRGVWPRHSQWHWGFAAGRFRDRVVALNIGHGYGDDSKGTACALIVDGRLHKLRDLPWTHAPERMDSPWELRNADGKVDLKFHPEYDQSSKTTLGPFGAELHKVHGRFSGAVTLESGERIEFRDFRGFLERMEQEW